MRDSLELVTITFKTLAIFLIIFGFFYLLKPSYAQYNDGGYDGGYGDGDGGYGDGGYDSGYGGDDNGYDSGYGGGGGGGGCERPGNIQSSSLSTSTSCSGTTPRITVRWGQASRASSYVVRRRTADPRGSWRNVSGTLGSGARSFTDTTVSQGVRYDYEIIPSNNCGDGGNIRQTSATAATCVPSNFDVDEVESSCIGVNSPQIALDWSTASGATSYEIHYANLADGIDRVLTTRPSSPTSYNITSGPFIPNNQYSFYVIAYNSGGFTRSDEPEVWTHLIYGPTVYPDCSPPVINLFLTSNGITKPHTDFPPLNIKQKEPVSISWNTTNVPNVSDACIASIPSSNPVPSSSLVSAWGGFKPSSSTGQAFPPILSIGDYQFSLSCDSQWGINSSSTITLTVTQLQKPFIQTTGGDIHTNESITIPRIP